MYAPINQIQSPDDEGEEQDDVVQESFLSYYNNHNFGEAQDFTAKSVAHQKCADFACFNGVSTASNPFKISCERLIQEGFDLAPPQVKAKKRKAEAVDGGGRVVRATGRKDRHSKVRTARGPRDRRVRLSPTTAIQFYDVQDRLGYDRPSKAIDWLIKEAKAAIDALDDQPLIRGGGSNAAAEDYAGGNANSRFSCFAGEAPPPTAADYLDQDYQLGFCSALNSLEPNWEMARLQKMFTWNSVSESSGNARGGGGGGGVEYSSCNSLAPPVSGHANLFREPLQSSIVHYASNSINHDFAGFNLSNELSKIAASATPKQDENLKKLIFSMPSAHCQD